MYSINLYSLEFVDYVFVCEKDSSWAIEQWCFIMIFIFVDEIWLYHIKSKFYWLKKEWGVDAG